jgi:hypothetical protein
VSEFRSNGGTGEGEKCRESQESMRDQSLDSARAARAREGEKMAEGESMVLVFMLRMTSSS